MGNCPSFLALNDQGHITSFCVDAKRLKRSKSNVQILHWSWPQFGQCTPPFSQGKIWFQGRGSRRSCYTSRFCTHLLCSPVFTHWRVRNWCHAQAYQQLLASPTVPSYVLMNHQRQCCQMPYGWDTHCNAMRARPWGHTQLRWVHGSTAKARLCWQSQIWRNTTRTFRARLWRASRMGSIAKSLQAGLWHNPRKGNNAIQVCGTLPHCLPSPLQRHIILLFSRTSVSVLVLLFSAPRQLITCVQFQ